MPAIRRIYGYTPSAVPAIFCDRLYPRGIRKETFAAVRCPQQSHLSVLAEVLGWKKVDWGDGA